MVAKADSDAARKPVHHQTNSQSFPTEKRWDESCQTSNVDEDQEQRHNPIDVVEPKLTLGKRSSKRFRFLSRFGRLR